MEIIIRRPLLNFNIDDPKSVNENFPQILENIKVASIDFYNAIHHKCYNELSLKEKITLRKYLIRGKYRATPFGRWAGLGIGDPQHQTPESINLEIKEKLLLKPKELYHFHLLKTQCNITLRTEKFQLGYLLNSNDDGFVYWEFNFSSESWKESVIEKNNILIAIYDHFHSNATIDFKEFSGWFNDSPKVEIFQCWKEIINSSFLIYPFLNDPEQKLGDQDHTKLSVDVFFKEPIPFNKNELEFLDVIKKQMGMLFSIENSQYLQKLKNVFLEMYDDRFITLKELFTNRKIRFNLLSSYQTNNRTSWDVSLLENQLFTELMGNFGKTLDLSSVIPHSEIAHWGSLTLLFKKAKGNQIFLEQATSKSPLSLTGRFSIENDFHNYNKKIFKSDLSRYPVEFFDFDLLESDDIHSITYHKDVTEKVLSFSGSITSGNNLSWTNIYIGICDGSWKLFDPKRNVELRPLIQNAVNPRKIKTPWGRLLYEIGAEDGIQLNPTFQKLAISYSFSPQINWNNLILKPKTWIYENSKSGKEAKKQAKEFLEKQDLPSKMLVGFADQEMVLNRHNPDDLEILIKELTVSPKVLVKDYDFLDTADNNHLQQIYLNLPLDGNYPKIPEKINLVERCDPNWIYLKIYLNEIESMTFLKTKLAPFLNGASSKIPLDWYYLTYFDDGFHLRIRIKKSCKTFFDEKFTKDLLYFINQQVEVGKTLLASYFPELSKYGNHGILISEKIFCLETKFILDPVTKNAVPLIQKSFEYKLGFCRILFLEVSSGLKIEKRIFEFSKSKSKTDPLTKSYFRKLMVELDKEMFEIDLGFINNYVESLQNHPLNQNNITDLNLVINHLHMFLNRLFLDEALETEILIWYLVYRKLGKKIFSQPKF